MEQDEDYRDCRLNLVRLIGETTVDDTCRLFVFSVMIGAFSNVTECDIGVAGEPVDAWLARRREKWSKMGPKAGLPGRRFPRSS